MDESLAEIGELARESLFRTDAVGTLRTIRLKVVGLDLLPARIAR